MDGITVGAVGAAIIAGLVSILGLVIGKEQKVSEFRQSWIDELRKCLIAYLANINAISDVIRSNRSSDSPDNTTLISNYKLLNEASNGIKLRVNSKEKTAKNLLASMENFERLAAENSRLTPDNIKQAELSFIKASKKLLKFEWKRVKRGEPTFVITKYSVIIITAALIFLFGYIKYNEYAILSVGSTTETNK